MWVPIVRLFRRIPLLPYVFLAVLALLGVSFLRQDKQSSQLEEVSIFVFNEFKKKLCYKVQMKEFFFSNVQMVVLTLAKASVCNRELNFFLCIFLNRYNFMISLRLV